MASSSVHSANGHIDAVHCVSQSSHNKGRTSLCGQFLSTDRSSCEPIVTQRAPDQLNQLIPTNGTVTMRDIPHKLAPPAAESGDTNLPTRLCVSQSSHNGGLASPTRRFQPLHRSSCESILTQRHRPGEKEPAASSHLSVSATAASSRATFAAVAARLSAVSQHASARDCGSRIIGNTASMPHA